MKYFVCPLHEATAEVLDAQGAVVTPATHYCPGKGSSSPYGIAALTGGCSVFYKGGNPVAGTDTVLVRGPNTLSAQEGWVEKTQAEAQVLFPLAGV